jgi:DNA-binding GntR family transcriptional regulator
VNNSIKEKLINQKLQAGQQLTNEELALYALMNQSKAPQNSVGQKR